MPRRITYPLKKEVVGKAVWTVAHSSAALFPLKPSPTKQKNTRIFLKELVSAMPCASCQKEGKSYLREHKPTLRSRNSYFSYLVDFHNAINKKLDKPEVEAYLSDEEKCLTCSLFAADTSGDTPAMMMIPADETAEAEDDIENNNDDGHVVRDTHTHATTTHFKPLSEIDMSSTEDHFEDMRESARALVKEIAEAAGIDPPEVKFAPCPEFKENSCARFTAGDKEKSQSSKVVLYLNPQQYSPRTLCFHPETIIMTRDGVKEIKDISIGDYVLSHDGLFHKVLNTFTRDYDGSLYSIKVTGLTKTLLCTPEHPFLVRRRSTLYQRRSDIHAQECLLEQEWLEAQSLTLTDYMASPVPRLSLDVQEIDVVLELRNAGFDVELLRQHMKHNIKNVHLLDKKIPVTGDFLFALGAYLADGYTCSGVVFCLSAKKQATASKVITVMQELCGLEGKSSWYRGSDASKGKTGLRVHFNSMLLNDLFRHWFGKNAHEKRIPPWIFNLPPERLIHFVKGYLSGDGCIQVTNHWGHKQTSILYSSVSPHLAFQLYFILLKMGIISSLRESINSGFKKAKIWHGDIRGQSCKALAALCEIPYVDETQSQKNYRKITNNNLNSRIRELKLVPYKGTVNNIEVEGANSYVAGGLSAHNCHEMAHTIYAMQGDMEKFKDEKAAEEFAREIIRKHFPSDESVQEDTPESKPLVLVAQDKTKKQEFSFDISSYYPSNHPYSDASSYAYRNPYTSSHEVHVEKDSPRARAGSGGLVSIFDNIVKPLQGTFGIDPVAAIDTNLPEIFGYSANVLQELSLSQLGTAVTSVLSGLMLFGLSLDAKMARRDRNLAQELGSHMFWQWILLAGPVRSAAVVQGAQQLGAALARLDFGTAFNTLVKGAGAPVISLPVSSEKISDRSGASGTRIVEPIREPQLPLLDDGGDSGSGAMFGFSVGD